MKILFNLLMTVIPLISTPNLFAKPGQIDIPVNFSGSQINALVFELEYSSGLRYLGYTRALDSPFVSGCQTAGERVQCAVFGFDSPLPEIPTGQVFTLHFELVSDAQVEFHGVSFGDINGQSVVGDASGGSITVNSLLGIDAQNIFIPVVVK